MTEAVTLKGFARFVETLAAATAALDDLSGAADTSGRIVANLASTTAPRLTGRLAASLVPEVEKSSVVVGTDVIYGPPIHNGWVAHNIRPQPFLATAFDRTQGQVVAAYDKAVGAALGQVEGV